MYPGFVSFQTVGYLGVIRRGELFCLLSENLYRVHGVSQWDQPVSIFIAPFFTNKETEIVCKRAGGVYVGFPWYFSLDVSIVSQPIGITAITVSGV